MVRGHSFWKSETIPNFLEVRALSAVTTLGISCSVCTETLSAIFIHSAICASQNKKIARFRRLKDRHSPAQGRGKRVNLRRAARLLGHQHAVCALLDLGVAGAPGHERAAASP